VAGEQRASELVDGYGGERGFGDRDFERRELLHLSEWRSAEPDCDYKFPQLIVRGFDWNDYVEWSA
jgi:hypothetical protein